MTTDTAAILAEPMAHPAPPPPVELGTPTPDDVLNTVLGPVHGHYAHELPPIIRAHYERVLEEYVQARIAAVLPPVGPDPELRDMPAADRVVEEIDRLRLPTRTSNALYRRGVTAIRTLAAMSELELLDVPGIGGIGVNEVRSALAAVGLELAESGDLETAGGDSDA